MTKSNRKSSGKTRRIFDESVTGIERTGKKCRNGYNFNKETNLCQGKLNIKTFTSLSELVIPDDSHSMTFESSNGNNTIMKLYNNGQLVSQIIMSEKDVKQAKKRGDKKIAKLMKVSQRIQNNPKLLNDPQFKAFRDKLNLKKLAVILMMVLKIRHHLHL
jgi:hypothetical protein